MPNISEQPFTPDKPRSSDDTELVGQVLGSEAEGEMQELLGEQQVESTEHETEIHLTSGEAAAAKGIEQKVTLKQRRQQYIEWAEDIGKDEKWVDKIFVFETNGRVRVDGDLRLNNTGISELPPGLYKVNGMLNLSDNRIKIIKNIPDSVTMLYLHNNRITQIRNIPDSIRVIDLENNPIESLSPLVGKTLLYLDIRKVKAEIIPRGINVDRINIHPSQTKLIADARKKGYNLKIM